MRALVEPAAELTADEVARYSRHLLLPELGREGQRRLKNAAVLVIGAGGLGSPALLYLAAAGVGTIGIVDDDVVAESNLQRQVIHGHSDLGRSKVDSAAEAIAELNPQVNVVRQPVRLDSSNALELLGGYDLVLDGTDNFATRYLVDDACALLGIPLVWGSILRFDGQVSVSWAAPRPDEDGVAPEPVTYRDLHPSPPPAGTVPSCAEGGVLGVVCAAIGSVMATEAVKLICGIGDPLLGRLLIFDALAMTWRTIRVRRALIIMALAVRRSVLCWPTTTRRSAGWLRRLRRRWTTPSRFKNWPTGSDGVSAARATSCWWTCGSRPNGRSPRFGRDATCGS